MANQMNLFKAALAGLAIVATCGLMLLGNGSTDCARSNQSNSTCQYSLR